MTRGARLAAAGLAALLAILSALMLERQSAGLAVDRMTLAGSPATITRPAATRPAPLVVIAHGYAGSRQMMRPFAISLARAGLAVVSIDLEGHGRNAAPMGADISSIEGTTAQLVAQVEAAARAALDLPGIEGPVSLLAHSMGTDVVIRAAERLGGAASVVAVSMYSDAVTPQAPARLLMISGAAEGRLREVALDRLRQVASQAGEGETVAEAGVLRRAVAIPLVGHVGVLYHPSSLTEARDWIVAAAGLPQARAPVAASYALWLAMLLGATLMLAWPLLSAFGPRAEARPAPLGRILPAVAAPVVPAVLAAWLVPDGALGLSAFGKLAAFLAVWGAVQLVALRGAAPPLWPLGAAGLAAFLAWGLVFALALDRYGAAFVPAGPRARVALLLLPGALLFALADARLVAGQPPWLRLAARAAPLAALLAAMVFAPRLGVAFTALPVMVLFWLVYGTAARAVSARSGIGAAGIGAGIALAWALAASTPLVAI